MRGSPESNIDDFDAVVAGRSLLALPRVQQPLAQPLPASLDFARVNAAKQIVEFHLADGGA